ncbi:MAG: 1-acyl-sn-glycerol-3-phosphate acyltransferase [Bacteroidia bacterium]
MDAIKKHKGPAILAMNHPNAFIDPIAITWDLFPVRTHYMARGDAFKPGLITFLLNQIGIIPIYRLRDGGKEGLLKNDDSYVAVNKLLAKNAKVIVYAEGLCIQERRLRPLKKGVARMVFGSFEAIKRDDLVVFPVGLNYSQPDKLRSDIFYNVGEPIRVADYLEDYKENQTKTYNKFLKHLTTEMKKLVTHIDDPINDKLVVNLETMFTYSYIKWNKQLDNLENRFNFTLRLTKTINKAQKNNPELTEDLRLKTAGYFKQLRVHNLRDWIIDPARKSLSKIYLLFFSLVMIVLLPFHVFGLIGNIAPYKLTEYLTKKAVKKNK